MRGEITVVYRAERPRELSRLLAAAPWPGNWARVESFALSARVPRSERVCLPARSRLKSILRDVGAVVELAGRVEAQDREVQAAVRRGLRVVAGGVLLELAQHVVVDADVQRVDRGDVGGGELGGRAVVERDADDALLVGFARNGAGDGRCRCGPCGLPS